MSEVRTRHFLTRRSNGGQRVRLWPDSDLPVDQRLCRLLEGKRTRYARREIFRV
jgi:hypothetical protein